MSRNARVWEAPPSIPSADFVSNLIYTDPDIYRAELERVKKRAWKLACHVSEIPNAYDFRRVNHAGIPLVVSRGGDGTVRTFINACSHRSAIVVRELSGNAKVWSCLFHHWSYNDRGECTTIPREEAYRESGLCKSALGLREVRTEVRLGMVFVNLDDEAPALDDYMNGALENLAAVMGDPEQELEVFHYSHAVLKANWKQWHETNMDPYHEYLHFVNRRVAMKGEGYFDRLWKLYPGGHATLPPMTQPHNNVKGWSKRDVKPLPGLVADEFRTVKMFADTNILCRATTMRIETSSPLGPNETLIEWRGLGVKGESDDDRAMRVQHFNQYWGPFGRNQFEDAHAAELVAEVNNGGAGTYSIIARHEGLRTQDDALLRNYYAEWSRMMGTPAHNPKVGV